MTGTNNKGMIQSATMNHKFSKTHGKQSWACDCHSSGVLRWYDWVHDATKDWLQHVAQTPKSFLPGDVPCERCVWGWPLNYVYLCHQVFVLVTQPQTHLITKSEELDSVWANVVCDPDIFFSLNTSFFQHTHNHSLHSGNPKGWIVSCHWQSWNVIFYRWTAGGDSKDCSLLFNN